MNICIITGVLCVLMVVRRLIQLMQLRMEEEKTEISEEEKVGK